MSYRMPGLPCPVCGELFTEGGYAFMNLGSARCWHGPSNPSDLVARILMLEERLQRVEREAFSDLTTLELIRAANANMCEMNQLNRLGRETAYLVFAKCKTERTVLADVVAGKVYPLQVLYPADCRETARDVIQALAACKPPASRVVVDVTGAGKAFADMLAPNRRLCVNSYEIEFVHWNKFEKPHVNGYEQEELLMVREYAKVGR